MDLPEAEKKLKELEEIEEKVEDREKLLREALSITGSDSIGDSLNESVLATRIQSLLNKNTTNEIPAVELKMYLLAVHQQSNIIKQFRHYMPESNYIEIKRQNDVREAERKDLWVLWRDKLVRWFLGVSAAIVLYSVFVALSNKWDFIKIPVRDMVVGG